MRMVVETEHTRERALLVGNVATPFMKALEVKLREYDMAVSHTAALPYSFKDIDYMFVSLDEYTTGELQQIFQSTTRILIITENKKIYNEFTHLINKNTSNTVRVVSLDPHETHTDIIERVLWFMLSQSSETSLNMSPLLEPAPHIHKKKSFTFHLSRKRKIVMAICIVVLLHTFFLIPMGISYGLTYTAATALKNQQRDRATASLRAAQTSFKFAQGAYVLAQPGLRFLFFSVFTDNLMKIEENALIFIDNTLQASANVPAIAALILNTHKDVSQIQEARTRIHLLEEQVAALEKSSQTIYDRLTYDIAPTEEVREEFERIFSYLRTGSQLIAHLDSILADNTEKTYIFFFYNNMEIRPGGGFIGSFAKVTFADYTLSTFDVYDVYDADGQLTTHVRPPAPIRDHLDQPHWFLRDSNFKPDFEENVKTAEFFLDKELQIRDFDGAVAITTTALTYMLDAFGEVYVPDFQETITSENFYLKTQSQTETDFFPGSKQKKSFLSTVGRTLLLKMEDADPAKLGIAVKRALDEKHIVLYTKDSSVQTDIDRLGWSGRVLNPQCITNAENCVINHILPVDANLGVNKANFFVSKSMRLKSTFDTKGTSHNELNIAFTNNSPPHVFPGGTYKNYFQMYIPHNARVLRVEVNGDRVTFDQSRTGFFTILGTLITVQPKETVVVTIAYELAERIKTGENTYQIVLQKQIGAFNHDFSLEVSFPEGVLITNQNFKSVAKNHSVLYNSSLSTNKVFVIEFVKE